MSEAGSLKKEEREECFSIYAEKLCSSIYTEKLQHDIMGIMQQYKLYLKIHLKKNYTLKFI